MLSPTSRDEVRHEVYEMVEAHLVVALIAAKEAVETIQASLAQVKQMRAGVEAGGEPT